MSAISGFIVEFVFITLAAYLYDGSRLSIIGSAYIAFVGVFMAVHGVLWQRIEDETARLQAEWDRIVNRRD